MRKNWIVVLILLVSSVGVFAESGLWDSEDLNFKFQPPTNWNVTVTEEDDISRVEARSDSDGSFIIIGITDSVDGDFKDYSSSDLDELREETRINIEERYGSVTVKDIDINGLKFLKYEIADDVNNDIYKLLGHYNDMLYQIHAFNDPSGANYNQNLVEQSIDSLIIYKSATNKWKDFFYGVIGLIALIAYIGFKLLIRGMFKKETVSPIKKREPSYFDNGTEDLIS